MKKLALSFLFCTLIAAPALAEDTVVAEKVNRQADKIAGDDAPFTLEAVKEEACYGNGGCNGGHSGRHARACMDTFRRHGYNPTYGAIEACRRMNNPFAVEALAALVSNNYTIRDTVMNILVDVHTPAGSRCVAIFANNNYRISDSAMVSCSRFESRYSADALASLVRNNFTRISNDTMDALTQICTADALSCVQTLARNSRSISDQKILSCTFY